MTRLTGDLVTIIAAVIAPVEGIAVAGSQTAWTLSTGKRAVIKKIMWRNRIGVNADLYVGYGDRTVAGSLFRRVLPRILMVNGVDGVLTEEELPLCGNTPEGFVNDTTVPTGSAGDILVACDNAGLAAGTPVEVILEVEET